MANFGNVAVSQKYNVHEIIAHFSPILYKKISGHFRISFFMSTGLILMNNLLKYELQCSKRSLKLVLYCFILVLYCQFLTYDDLLEPDFFFGTEEVLYSIVTCLHHIWFLTVQKYFGARANTRSLGGPDLAHGPYFVHP